ncbi:hypothetical protein UlMin_000269 [Ulmus minor]
MAGESGAAAGDTYIGSFISLISKYEIRYEGVLYHLNVKDSTIALKNVKSYGTEGRKEDGPQIPPSDKVYEYILFRGSDIKDLQVKSPPPALTEEQTYTDPAIIESHTGVPASSVSVASVSKITFTEPNQWLDTPALTSRGYPSISSSYQSVTQPGQSELPHVTQKAMHLYGYNGMSISNPQQHVAVQPPSMMLNPLTMQQQLQASQIQASMTLGLSNTSEFRTPTSASTSTSVHPKLSPSLSPVQNLTSPDVPSPLSMQVSLASRSTSLTPNALTASSYPLSQQDNINGSQTASESVQLLPVQSMPHSVPSSTVSNLGPMLTSSPSLLASDQLLLSGPYMLYPNQQDIGALTPLSSDRSSFVPAPIAQRPLLPLPNSSQKTVQFTEEFDFIAMNEKFKKDEVWGYLGKAKQIDNAQRSEEKRAGHSLENKKGHGSAVGPQPAYNKDEFFDTISCNSLNHGARSGQIRFPERVKLNSETFGFEPRPNPGYGGYGVGRGENFRGPYNWGRGYGYGGRGRGGNAPFY